MVLPCIYLDFQKEGIYCLIKDLVLKNKPKQTKLKETLNHLLMNKYKTYSML